MNRAHATFLLTAALPATITVSACSDFADTESAEVASSDLVQVGKAQMNDLSVMLWATDRWLDPDSVGRGQEKLVPEPIWQALEGSIEHQQSFGSSIPRDRYVVVGLRLDPCANVLAPAANGQACVNEIRLTWERLRDNYYEQEYGEDGGVHTIYRVDRAEMTEVIKGMIALREANQATRGAPMGPLATHPIIAAQGIMGPMAQGVKKIILEHVSAKNLVRATAFSWDTWEHKWTFGGIDVNAGVAAEMGGPLSTGLFMLGHENGYADPFRFTDQGFSGRTDLFALGNSANAAQANKAELQKSFDAAVAIENPTLHSAATIDCASCHMAQPLMDVVGASSGLTLEGNPNRYVPPPSIDQADMAKAGPVVNALKGLNIHAFSSNGGGGTLNRRVINETAATVAYVNANILRQP
jgi:hypothetical protein